MFNVTKNHYLSNGNKRIAIIITSILYWEETARSTLIDFNILESIVLKIADGTIVDKEEALKEICKSLPF